LGVPVVVVHGGAGRWSLVFRAAERGGLGISESSVRLAVEDAAKSGLEVLLDGGSPVRAAAEAVRRLEDSGLFNAGLGSSIDAAGGISMDAGVMSGEGPRAGAVVAVRRPRNPVLLALYVMMETPHVIMCCEWADTISARIGLDPHPGPGKRALTLRKFLLEELRDEYGSLLEAAKRLGLALGDTVGAVAVDGEGRVGVAVSTGGTSLKLPGRVGDSPVPGAGFYALNGLGGAVVTGKGEHALLSLPALRAVEGMRSASPGVAGRLALDHVRRLTGGRLGMILASPAGRVAAVFTTEAMPWAVARPGKTVSGLWEPYDE